MHLDNDYIVNDSLLEMVNASQCFLCCTKHLRKCSCIADHLVRRGLYVFDHSKNIRDQGKLKEGKLPSDRYVGTIANKQRKVLMYQSGNFDYYNMSDLATIMR